MRRLLFCLLLVLSGCAGPVYELDEKWLPLEGIRESKIIGLGTTARAIAPYMYVESLDVWLKEHPEPFYTAALTHERTHVVRQLEDGYRDWFKHYLTDTSFMWKEEQVAYYHHIKYLNGHGVQIVPESWAKNLTKYFNLVGRMVTYEQALEWLNQVLQGQWHPPQGE